LHFSFPQRERKIKVATSVCTGGSNMPPAYCDLIFESVPHKKKKAGMTDAISAFLAQVARLELAVSRSKT